MENGLRMTCGRDSKSWEINRFFRETSSELGCAKPSFLGTPSNCLHQALCWSLYNHLGRWFTSDFLILRYKINTVAWFQPAATDAIRPSKMISNAIMLKWFLEWTWLSKTSQSSSWMQKLHLLHHFQHILDHDHHQASSNSHGSLAGNRKKMLWICPVSQAKQTIHDCSQQLEQAADVFVLRDVLQPLQCFCYIIFQGFYVGPLKSLRYLCWSIAIAAQPKHQFPHDNHRPPNQNTATWLRYAWGWVPQQWQYHDVMYENK